MRIDYAKCHKTEVENERVIEFSYYSGLSTKEWALTVEVKDGQAVKVLSGDVIGYGGWYNWDEGWENESEILIMVNEIYKDKLGGNENVESN